MIDACDFIVGHAFRLADVPKATRAKRRVAVEVYLKGSGRPPDPTNLEKVLLDALVTCGAIYDDSQSYLESTPPVIARGDRRTVITITQL